MFYDSRSGEENTWREAYGMHLFDKQCWISCVCVCVCVCPPSPIKLSKPGIASRNTEKDIKAIMFHDFMRDCSFEK